MIYALKKSGHNQSEIAKEIGVHRSTVSRELTRNISKLVGSWSYKPDYANTYAEERKKYKPKCVKMTLALKNKIINMVKQEWSPEQISGYAKKHKLFSISHETIYRFILRDKKQGGDLYLSLRHQHKKYRKRYGSPQRQYTIKERTMIDERPSIVDEKQRIGDWEVDTIIGKGHKQAIVSIVERKSKFTILKKVQLKTADLVSKSTIEALMPYKDVVLTITSDNGTEFAYHKKIAKELETDFYFAHPYSSWERGLNENTNGLVRQYIKKGSDMSHVDEDLLVDISNKLNSRPRKTLNYLTPNEILEKNKYINCTDAYH
jgi:IS30 family transposase